ncbi:MAG: flagellar export protein FliJ [Thermodesulforhabdaceae bacterium]
MAFRFRYDSLLEYREKLLEREQYELAKIAEEARKIERECARLEMERFKCAEFFSAKQIAGMSPEECKLFSESLEALEHRLLEERARLKKALEKLEEQRQKLVEMNKKVEMLRVLKAEQEEEYRREVSKLDQKTSDELMVLKWGKSSDEI